MLTLPTHKAIIPYRKGCTPIIRKALHTITIALLGALLLVTLSIIVGYILVLVFNPSIEIREYVTGDVWLCATSTVGEHCTMVRDNIVVQFYNDHISTYVVQFTQWVNDNVMQVR